MKYTAALALASVASTVSASADNCVQTDGNYYCSAVDVCKYTNLVTSGSYKAVSQMDSSGTCNFVEKAYSGPIAPFDEELSIHIRGPVQLKSFAAYTPSTSSKRDAHKSHRRHGHQHLHQKHAEEKQEAARAVGDLVTAVIDGKVAVWTNTYDGTNGAASPAEEAKPAQTAAAGKASTASASKATTSSYVAPGDYKRIAYYDAESQVADGVTFLGNYGGSGSGVFDTTWGNSLSYLSADGTTGAASPNILQNVLVGDNKEYSIWTADKCADGDAACGYSRPGSVAYHGFGGADKVFLFEFTMPLSGKTGFNMDMGSIWALNAQIPRTGQYSECSCWKSNCGEADFFEVLTPGETKAKSTFHFQNSLGSSDYFKRPTDGYIKIAAVFQEATQTATIKVLDNSVDFASSLTGAAVSGFVETTADSILSSVMNFLSS